MSWTPDTVLRRINEIKVIPSYVFKGFNISGEIKQTYKKQLRCKIRGIDSVQRTIRGKN